MAEVTIGAEDYAVFADTDFADPYLAADVLRADDWESRSDVQKARGLVSATRMLNTLPWIAPAPATDDEDLPAVVKEVASMLAADLLAKPKLFVDASGNSNIKSAGAGSAKVEFFRPVEDGAAIPRSMWDALVAAGLVGTVGSPDGLAGAIVTGISSGRRPLYGRPAWDYPVAAADHD